MKKIEATCDVCGSACGDQGAEISLHGSSIWLSNAVVNADVCSSPCALKILRAMVADFEEVEAGELPELPKKSAAKDPYPIACKDNGLHAWVGSKCMKCDAVFPVNAAAPIASSLNVVGPQNGGAIDGPKKRGPKKAKPEGGKPTIGDLYAGVVSIPPLPDTPDPLAAKAAGINPNDKAAPRHGDQTISEPPTWCGACGAPRVFVRDPSNHGHAYWLCSAGHAEGPALAVRHGVPGENIGLLVNNLKAKGLLINLVEVAAWPVVQRDVARAWLVQGGDLPDFLVPLVVKAPAEPAPAPVFEF